MSKALILGVSGQFGSYMADLLLSKGYIVVGATRRRSEDKFERVEHLRKHPNFYLETIDILDSGVLRRKLYEEHFDEIYLAAAQSHVGLSWKEPYNTGLITGLGVTNVLDAVRDVSSWSRLWFAGSSEQFGRVLETPQNEKTPFNPLSPYAAAKVYGFNMVKIYRESFGLFCCSSIMFNSESPRRSSQFVTKKITEAVARIKYHKGGELKLGSLDTKRDWSHVKDTVRGAWLMLQQDMPNDFVFASGRTHTIKDFLRLAFGSVGLDWQDYVVQDEGLMRPNEVNLLLGDAEKAADVLGWRPEISFEELVKEMVSYDMVAYEKKMNAGAV